MNKEEIEELRKVLGIHYIATDPNDYAEVIDFIDSILQSQTQDIKKKVER